MKNLIFILLKFGMKLIYALMKLFVPNQNKAVFLSRQSDLPSENFLLIADELRRRDPDIKCEFYCKLGLKSGMGLSYIILMLRQMAALAGAKICITESYCIPISILKHKKRLKIIQIWHSMVAIKKFGWQTVDMPEGSPRALAEIMQMHNGYDWVICGSDYMRKFFAKATRTDISKVLALGLPEADRLMQTDGSQELRRSFANLHPDVSGKKIVLYLPTMRRDYPIDCQELVELFDYERFALIIKLHPLDSNTVISDERVILNPPMTTREALMVADVVISDYSGAAAEAAVMNIPVYFFVPDVAQYNRECGLNVNPLRIFPNVSFTSARNLVEAINSGRAAEQDAELIRELFCGGCDGHSTEKIVDLALR